MSDPATQKQIAYIKALGGKPKRGLTKQAASELIDKLRSSAPPTQKQVDLLQKLGATIPRKLTTEQASELIARLGGDQPPTKQQIKYIKMLGGEVPATKREASELCKSLPSMAPPTSQQRKQAQDLGISLPENATYAEAKNFLIDAENDADPEEGKPPTKAQLNKIAKLGGDVQKATTWWRADDYLSELEDKAEELKERSEDALDAMGCPEMGLTFRVKKPSKAVMKKAILFGDSQGWGKGWEESIDPYDIEARMDFAIYSVAPELLQAGESPPLPPTQNGRKSSKSKGCLLVLAAIISAPLIIWRLIT